MRKITLLFLAMLLSAVIYAQERNFWTPVNAQTITKDLFANRYKPGAYKLFQLNEQMITRELTAVPSEKTVLASQSSFVLSIPNSEGQIERYSVVEAPVMDAALAAKYPSIKSYAGQGIDEPSSFIRFDMSPEGFHGMILSGNRKTIYIDPLDRAGRYYVVFSRKDVVDYQKSFNCLTDETHNVHQPPVADANRSANDGRLRTYRLALACTGEYSAYFLNGTETSDAQRKAKVLAAMNTAMTRTNGIYERDFGIRMVLIANNDAIIYLNAASDPWGSELNSTTQTTIDNVIGNAGYDIGHLVHRASNNGNAGCIGCICVAGQKGSAFTSHVDPVGDPFVVDYLTHEMGHQFGGNHTFSFRTEGTGVNVEPGSGTTIMGYAGITGSNTDVQPNSDDYFHARSIDQITAYIKGTTGNSCAVSTLTGNNAPTANAGLDYTIPRSTPFLLTGSGSDADATNVLNYTWEQVDNASSSAQTIPSATATSGPVFRSRYSGTNNTRSFPALASVLDGTNNNKWEVLPSVARTLNLRLTVRDNNAGGGSNNFDNMVVTVSSAAGPFAVTAPNTAVSWAAGSAQTISWSVNSTNIAPVNCANVKISLSTDGGLTFPIVIAASTPNDGSELVTIPANPGTQSRIKIEAVGNIFYDISNTNFTISGAVVCGDPIGLTASAITTSSADISWTAVSGANSYDVDYKLASSGTWTNAATGTTATSVSLSGLTAASVYDWRVRANCTAGSGNYTAAQFTTLAACGTPAGLTTTAITTSGATAGWTAVSGATSYDVDYKLNSAATWINAATATAATSVNLSGLTAATAYNWRVRANCAAGSSVYATANFTTTSATCVDVLEPNNSSNSAATLTLGTNLNALIASTSDRDWYRFSNTTTQRNIRVSLTNLPFDYDVKLYNSGGSNVATSQNGSTTSELILYNNTAAAGTYRVQVYGYQNAFSTTRCYTLLVQLSATNWTSRANETVNGGDVLKLGGIKVYPIPATNSVNLAFDATRKGSSIITITNQLGAEMMRKTVSASEGINFNTVDVSRLVNGVYIIKVQTGDNFRTEKLVIQR
jgi:Metallo-peptidase family M12B Reprolysin-like/Secretion system C-terminal sorting domain/Bacterial pre-peptidase C-terminal domain/Fibronectin type III domain